MRLIFLSIPQRYSLAIKIELKLVAIDNVADARVSLPPQLPRALARGLK